MIAPLLAGALLALADTRSAAPVGAEYRGTFVTTLGSDTVAVESYVRTKAALEGDILLRVPGVVRYHYKLTFADDGSVKRSDFDIKPAGGSGVEDSRRLVLDFDRGSVRAISTVNGEQSVSNVPIDFPANVWFLGGYGSSFGIYASYGMYEYLLTRVPIEATATTTLSVLSAATGQASTRLFKRPTSTTAELDYFKMAWIHATLDDAGTIIAADASETTERTTTRRVAFIDMRRAEQEPGVVDKAGKGLGVASPNVETQASVAGASVVVRYGSPRLRGRSGAMAALVSAGNVWRTGANEATLIELNRDLRIGNQHVPAGKYSLWTLPKADGVELIVNKQTGQWGTNYEPAQDLVRIPMTMMTADKPLDAFAIVVQAAGAGGELRIQWDTFVWSVSLTPATQKDVRRGP
jgi:Protein of unknown function (DUF2911)